MHYSYAQLCPYSQSCGQYQKISNFNFLMGSFFNMSLALVFSSFSFILIKLNSSSTNFVFVSMIVPCKLLFFLNYTIYIFIERGRRLFTITDQNPCKCNLEQTFSEYFNADNFYFYAH